MNILETRNIQVAYGQTQILWGMDMQAKRGKVTTIMGRNGVGKTTFLRTIMGLLRTKDPILFNGEEIQKRSTYKRAKKGIGYVPQGREIISKLTVYENILIGTESRSDSVRSFDEDEIYGMFPILKDFRNRLGGNLSGGQQQQLAIARALVGKPDLLILDEPTEGIQPSITLEIAGVLNQLVEHGMSILLVEQKLDFARLLSDYYYIMDRGKVVRHADKDTIDFDELKTYLSV
ncbi:ABC-type urea/branched-chain amino acid transporter ATP-binding [Bacteroidales bacterium Barb6]|nr:ABC-type urea/branched-chain amino acid transporter ATP-binding [Bacteroidales bacterium Barb4]OAV72611.1 ABC-type urea/branched-chain amino acid transporter ATP-binding [Bacteroidales bacterium Barb6]OAV74250.1 ABC-type urea/branched-chain amino acid transporter ATP-binding [Bacteroidales bacterium Barb7]